MPWILLILAITQPQGLTSQEGTAVVRGRITDAQTGAGMSHALVTLHLPRSDQRKETLADRDGYYEFRGLPAGPVLLEARAGESRATHVPHRFSHETSTGARTTAFALADGEVREGMDIALVRALAIAGRVIDDAGEPLAGVWVRAFRAPGGQSVAGRGRDTDDRGAFRLFGLAPGRYFVCAEPGTTHAFSEPVGGDRRRDPVSACHRSTADAEMGAPITLTRSDVAAVEIVAPRSPTLTVSGVVLDANGEPASASVSTTVIRLGTGGEGSIWRTHDDGRFTITGLSPGLYVFSASTMSRGEPAPAADPQYAEMELALDVDDVTDLVLAMRRPARLKGRVLFDGGRPPEAPTGLLVRTEGRMRGAAASNRAPEGAVDSDDRFELVHLIGPQVVTVSNLPRGWIVKAVRYRDADVTDLPTEFRTGPDEVEIELTTRGAVLMGTVTDRSGNSGFPGRVVMFPADPARWHSGLARSAVPIGRDGRFSLPARRAGDYLVVALTEEDYDGLGHAPSFELLENNADRVTLLDDDRRVIDLRLATLPNDDGR